MSVHPIFAHLLHQLGEGGAIPQHPSQPLHAVDLDDRMACAVAQINEALAVARRRPLDARELALLRDRRRFRVFVTALGIADGVDLSSPLALLSSWHAWHNGG